MDNAYSRLLFFTDIYTFTFPNVYPINMQLPPITEFGFSSIVYLILIYILIRGLHQLYQRYSFGQSYKRSLVPLGAVGLIFGIIGYIQGMREAFAVIAEAGDISPALVAGGITQSFAYPTLGLLTLAAAYLFKYLNPPVKKDSWEDQGIN